MGWFKKFINNPVKALTDNKVVDAAKDVGRTVANTSANMMTGGLAGKTGLTDKWGLGSDSMHTGFMRDTINPLASGLSQMAGQVGLAVGLPIALGPAGLGLLGSGGSALGSALGALGLGGGGLGGILGGGGVGQGGGQGGGQTIVRNKTPQNVPEMMPVEWMTPPTGGETPMARGLSGEDDLQRMMADARQRYWG